MVVINSFTGRYAFLSNFSNDPATYEGVVYPTVEHAFQAAKCQYEAGRKRFLTCATPAEAKRLGRAIAMREDWEDAKIAVMFNILRSKFTSVILQNKLLATGDALLVEGNDWGDTFWGVDNNTGAGKNWLGTLLMMVRATLYEEAYTGRKL